MKYHEIIRLKDGRICTLRNGTEYDGQAALKIFLRTHEQTDYLLTYPDENRHTAEEEARFLKEKSDSENEIEILAEIHDKAEIHHPTENNGKSESDGESGMNAEIVGMAGIEIIEAKEKVKHRAAFGISVDRDFWGLGIGRALTKACIERAKNAGYSQLELEVVADNERAVKLYRNEGFVEYGRNPRGFRSRLTGWQELILMRLELDQ